MKLNSPLPSKRGRLEIIPLIDIMFFLLAAFMIVSLDKIRIKSLKITLPTDVPAAQKETKEDFVSISLNATSQVQIDKELLTTKDAVVAKLKELYANNKEQKLLISADKDSTHGAMMQLLGTIRATGFQKVAFSIKGDSVITGAPAPSAAAPVAPTGQPAVGAAPAPAPEASAPPAPPPVPAPAASPSPEPTSAPNHP